MSGCRSCSGRLFHSVGPAVAKQRSPNWLHDLLTKHIRNIGLMVPVAFLLVKALSCLQKRETTDVVFCAHVSRMHWFWNLLCSVEVCIGALLWPVLAWARPGPVCCHSGKLSQAQPCSALPSRLKMGPTQPGPSSAYLK